MAVSHIMLEAYKKLILVALILQGKVCTYYLGRLLENVTSFHAELTISPYPITIFLLKFGLFFMLGPLHL